MTGNPAPQASVPRVRRRLEVRGLVQGVGFRPFVYRLAREERLTGWVRNTSQGVELEVEGEPAAVAGFMARLRAELPPLARLDEVRLTELPLEWDGAFVIRESHGAGDTEPVIPPDAGLCRECAREVLDPTNRRFRYPFTNCTHCGPRFTIIRQVPYDRDRTTMAAFAMCPDCRREYEDPGDRRFHAEPTACPVCGPRAWVEQGGRELPGDAVEVAAALLKTGRIVAVKGLGGFHLACDARNREAVRLLRARKGRRDKPFAVMVRDLAEARRVAYLDDQAVALLLSPARPIVLVPAREDADLAPEVAPGHRLVGLLLPYTPLHLLLLQAAPPALVMTSGNLSEEPLVADNAAARMKLASLADAFLCHDREIEVPCDDSVVRVIPGGMIPIRRARGYVPQPLALPVAAPQEILGVGAEQKSTFCLAWGDKALLSQHLGDLDSPETYDYFRRAVRHLAALSRRRPMVAAHDLHPDYLSSRYARELSGVRLIGVQHHHAHLAACLAENGVTGPALGLALDGTGFGPDGTVWGGELLVADLASFTRLGHLAWVRLPGGEAAIRRPARMAAAYLWAAYGEGFQERLAALGLSFEALERRLLERQLAAGWQSPLTSSAGRLFDAAAAALGICRVRTYEGQPAIALEMAAAPGEDPVYPFPVAAGGGKLLLDGPALFRAAVEDALAGTVPARVAGRFLASFSAGLAEALLHARERTGLSRVALSGGVFQNALVVQSLSARLAAAGFEVLTHHLTPPNDACISLGQVAVAAARLKGE
ncbi:MAG: carbamoyltransferase HypF [Syntrophobacterales bacterium]|nr:carbamoyltransferase HypF [Syntrophobacterales bacterium]